MPLVQLIDFPDYDIDTATGDVFRRKTWANHNLPLQGYQKKRILRGTPKYHFQVGNTQRTCTVGRLLASARLGVSLDRLPRRMIFRPDGARIWQQTTIGADKSTTANIQKNYS
jgi:hypothetical protein